MRAGSTLAFQPDLWINLVFKTVAELSKAVKTIFLGKYLRDVELRQEINAGLNVVENWNSAHSFIFYGKGGEFATNRLEDQELAVLCLHLLQISLVYINTLMIQQVLSQSSMDKVNEKGGFAGAFAFILGSRQSERYFSSRYE